jgi:opacity protein-like surface antigen
MKALFRGGGVVALALAASLTATPAAADLSAFVAAVGFDDEANLDGAPGIGLRWGKSSGVIGGETSLMISRPERSAAGAAEASTAIFYEGRVLLNIPVGQIKPFVGLGYGAITILPGDLEAPTGADASTVAALQSLSDTETNQAFSYGGGVRYALNERIDGRVDLRQYQVFSVKGAVVRQVAGDEIADALEPEENTVTYSEFSVGVVFRF